MAIEARSEAFFFRFRGLGEALDCALLNMATAPVCFVDTYVL